MKIYCLLLDAMPWGGGRPSDVGTGRSGGLAGIAEKGGLTGLTQICGGMFTTTTLLSMFTGRLPSDIVPGGVGYLSHQEERYFDWMKKRDINLLDLLKQASFEVRLHHHLDYLLRMLCGFRGEDPVSEFDAMLAHGDDRFSHVRLSGWDPQGAKLDVFEEYGDADKCATFYSNEAAYIRDLQAERCEGNMFFLTQQQDWHDSWYRRDKRALPGARARTEEWLSQWDFTEPDAVFWVFSDHGYQVANEVTPKDSLAWVLFRDNTTKPMRPARSLISSLDFYATMLHKAGLDRYGISAPDSISVHLPATPTRIFLGEDSRVKVEPRFCCSAVVSCVTAWSTGEDEETKGLDGGALTTATARAAREEAMLMLVYHAPSAPREGMRAESAEGGVLCAYEYQFFHENPYAFDKLDVSAVVMNLEPSARDKGVAEALVRVLETRFSWIAPGQIQHALQAIVGKQVNAPETCTETVLRGEVHDTNSSTEQEEAGGRRRALPDGLILLPNGMVLPARAPGVVSRERV